MFNLPMCFPFTHVLSRVVCPGAKRPLLISLITRIAQDNEKLWKESKESFGVVFGFKDDAYRNELTQ